MSKGYYALTSGMLTQNRNLGTISNNLANMATPGYKKDTLLTTTFSEELLYRTGNLDKSKTLLNSDVKPSKIVTGYKTSTDHTQGGFDETERTLDFAINGEGYFQIQKPDGGTAYTRNGSFTIDDGGHLALQHIGRVLGQDGQPITLDTDKITVNGQGTILSEDNQTIGQLGLVNFTNKDALVKVGEGMFQNNDAANLTQQNVGGIIGKTLERSNVDPMKEMMEMMTSQRALQSASQVLKIYDQILSKASTDIGRL